MTTAQAMEWLAYEQVAGPLLVHERVDLGFATLAYQLNALLGRKRVGFRDFLPPWLRPKRQYHDPLKGFQELLDIAEGRTGAHD